MHILSNQLGCKDGDNGLSDTFVGVTKKGMVNSLPFRIMKYVRSQNISSIQILRKSLNYPLYSRSFFL